MRAGRRRPGWLSVVLGLVALLVLGLGGAWGFARYVEHAACNPERRTILEEFPQYGGRQPEPEADPTTTSACNVRFSTTDPEEEIFAYYSERLRENGWEIDSEPPPYSEVIESTDPEATVPARIQESGLRAKRGDHVYDVSYTPQSRSNEGRVIVTVGESRQSARE